MKRPLSLAFVLLFMFSTGFTQKRTTTEETFRDAEFFFTSGEYEEALFLFLQLTRDVPDNHNFHFRAGMSFLNVPGRETEAIPYFEKAVENTTQKYKEKDFRATQAPHHAWFYLGNAYRINNELSKALDSYEKFMDIRNFESKYNLSITENEIAACQRAKIIQDSPVKMIRQNLGTEINSSSHNYQAVVNRDETVMVYMQKQRFYDAVMYSSKENGKWSKPVNITPQVGSDGDMVPTGISADGKELLLVKRIADQTGDIYYSKLEGNFWSRATDLGRAINSPKNENHASFSSDGSYIVFSSDRRGGYGKLDLYMARRLSGNSFSEPVNMGPGINTEEDETSAYLTMNDNHLYFSSSGHFNMGGFDIFFSEKTEEGWTRPVNLGYPVNTTGDNKYYQPVQGGNVGYIHLFNQKENIGEEDIYRVEMESLAKIHVPDSKQMSKRYHLELRNKITNEVIKILYDKKQEKFILEPPYNETFELLFQEINK